MNKKEGDLLNAIELERAIYDLFLQFFFNAEKKRRWSISDDIPWAKATGNVPEIVTKTVAYFTAVEELIPDYGPKLTHLNRGSASRSSLMLNWGYEELRHGIALRKWMIESGKRTKAQVRDAHQALLDQAEWNLPFDTQMAMFIYTTIQELATRFSYANIMPMAKEDPALCQTLKFLASDESAHHNLFFKIVKLYLKHKRDETIEAIKKVFDGFSMPGYSVPIDTATIRDVAQAGIYSARIFIADVKKPIYRELGRILTTTELRAAGALGNIVGFDDKENGMTGTKHHAMNLSSTTSRAIIRV